MDTYKEFKQQADDSASALDDVASLSQQQPTERRTRSRRRRAAAVATALLLVAVALGVGLGVGLRHRKSVADDASATIAPTSQRAPLAVQTPPESNFVLKGQTAMSAEAPTTRYYDFVVQQRDGAPDGFNKSMLVVNGRSRLGESRSKRLPADLVPSQACTRARPSRQMLMTASSSM